MKISVVIPAFNEEKLLPATLRAVQASLPAFHLRGWETEIIVCDNNSTDRTAELASAAGARVVGEAVNQISRARNTGAAAADGDWLIFVDADSEPTRELFADVAEQVASGTCLAGGALIRMQLDHWLAQTTLRLWNWLSLRRNLLAGSFIFCEAAAFRAISGFSEELFASEELDLSRRLKLRAKERAQRIVILDQHPLLSSPRKVHLYTLGEHLRFLARLAIGFGRPLRNREACFQWYDGRR